MRGNVGQASRGAESGPSLAIGSYHTPGSINHSNVKRIHPGLDYAERFPPLARAITLGEINVVARHAPAPTI